MSSLTNTEEGENVSVTIRKRGDNFFVADGDVECMVILDESINTDHGDQTSVSGAVTKKIFDTDGQIDYIFLSVSSAEITDSAGGKIGQKPLNSETQSAPQASKTVANSSTNETPSQAQNSRPTGSSSNKNEELDKIAEDLIGDKEIEVSEDEESVVGEAKQRAKDQQRDPAIDPTFNQNT